MSRKPTVLALLVLLHTAGGMAKHKSFPAGDSQELKVAADSQKVQMLQLRKARLQLRMHRLGPSRPGLVTFVCCSCSPGASATRTAAMLCLLDTRSVYFATLAVACYARNMIASSEWLRLIEARADFWTLNSNTYVLKHVALSHYALQAHHAQQTGTNLLQQMCMGHAVHRPGE